MTGNEFKQFREDLGTAIGRRLSLADMAKLCGLAPNNGADTIRKWEDGSGPSGPVSALLSIFRHAVDGTSIPNELAACGAEMIKQSGNGDKEIAAKATFQFMMMAEVVRRLRD